MAEYKQSYGDWWASLDTTNDVENKFQSEICRESSRTRGRAVIVKFSSDGRIVNTPSVYNDVKPEFESELKQPTQNADKKVEGSLVILEDLDKSWVEVIGDALNIPPYFFALHWSLPSRNLLGRARLPLGQSPHRHFMLNYKQQMKLRVPRKIFG
ncbi:hypothetical protein M426DRAFT_238267 [Hypoxylon sp. CI-4A]|nr:hypothetical protein M426DRAFT_238267 [Hypoxylon sp. CI-4A]